MVVCPLAELAVDLRIAAHATMSAGYAAQDAARCGPVAQRHAAQRQKE
jgi:hypothetical protein